MFILRIEIRVIFRFSVTYVSNLTFNSILVIGSRELECCICKTKVNNGSNTGRILTRLTLDASGYDASSANEIDICVCQKCKAKGIKPKTVTYVFNLNTFWMIKYHFFNFYTRS